MFKACDSSAGPDLLVFAPAADLKLEPLETLLHNFRAAAARLGVTTVTCRIGSGPVFIKSLQRQAESKCERLSLKVGGAARERPVQSPSWSGFSEPGPILRQNRCVSVAQERDGVIQDIRTRPLTRTLLTPDSLSPAGVGQEEPPQLN